MKRLDKRGYQCAVFGCYKRYHIKSKPRSDSEGTEDDESWVKKKHARSFHKFPKNPELLSKWIHNMGRPNWCPSKSSRICSDHFVEEMFDRTGQFVRLCKHAFPTRFKSFTRYLIKKNRSEKSSPKKKSNLSEKTSDDVSKGFKSAKRPKAYRKRKFLPKLKCFHCGYTTHYTVHMNDHIVNFHLRVKTYTCNECSKITISKKLLAQHKKQSHHTTNEVKSSDPRICNCGYESSSFSQFRRHFRFNHMPNFPWTCSLCSFVSAKENQLKVHVANNHQQTNDFLCGLCGFKSTKREIIKLHCIRRHFRFLNFKQKPQLEHAKKRK